MRLATYCTAIMTLPFVMILKIVSRLSILTLSPYKILKRIEILLYGDSPCNVKKNNSILSASINYIKEK